MQLTLFLTGTAMFAALYFLYNYIEKNTPEMKYANRGIILLIETGLLFRLVIAPMVAGYSSDIGCFRGWSENLFTHGFAGLYSNSGFLDYPPGYMYILYIVGAIRRLFSLSLNSPVYNVLLKLPSIIADVLCGFVIYRFALEKHAKSLALTLAALFIFNPMVYLNSSLWGQVDSVFTLLIMLSLIKLYKSKHIYSAILYALALLLKPQAVIVFPVFLYYIIRLVREEKLVGLKSACISALAGAAVFFVLVIPFSPSGNPLWIFGLYQNTLSSYPYATLNTPNLYGLFRGNGANIYKTFFIFDYNVWSNIFIASLCALSAVIYFRSKRNEGIFGVSAFLIAGMYTLAAKMHERYVFPAIALLILYYIVSKKKLSLLFCLLVSFTAYIATAWVLALNVTGMNSWIAAGSRRFMLLSLLGVASFIWMTIWLIRGRKAAPVAVKAKTDIKRTPVEVLEEPKMIYTRKDAMLLLGLTLFYTVIAFCNLGDMKMPETVWENKLGDVVIADTGTVQQIAVFNVLNGRKPTASQDSNNKPVPQYKLEVSTDGTHFEAVKDFAVPSVFKWESFPVGKSARYVRLSAISSKDPGFLNEIALYDENEQQIKIVNVVDKDGNTVRELYDEQNKTVFRPAFQNSTYFDEIYYARTAYEINHGIEAYEWTHPPIGKLLIAASVRVLGMNPFGWRFVGTFFGILMLPLMYAIAKRLFKSTGFAFFATFLMCFDFMHFTQTRIATIDTYATFFIMVMYYFMLRFFQTNYLRDNIKTPLKYLLLCGVFFGIGSASKWTCIYAGLGLAALFAIHMIARYKEYKQLLTQKNDRTAQEIAHSYRKRTLMILLWCVVYFIVIPICIYWLSYIQYAFVAGNSFAMKDIWRIQDNMYKYHTGLKAEHSFSSFWYMWPIMARPIWYFSGGIPEKNIVSSISAFGNPAIWWTSIVATLMMLYIMIKRALKRDISSDRSITGRYAVVTAVFILVGYLAEYLPFVGVKRVMFIYHYFTSVPFIILIITYVAWQIYAEQKTQAEQKTFRTVLYVYMGVVAGLFFMFYPVISGFEVPKGYITHCLTWFSTWIFGG